MDDKKYDTNPTELLRELLERVNGLDNKLTALDNKVSSLQTEMRTGFADVRKELRLTNNRLDQIAVEWTKTNARVTELEQQHPDPNAPTTRF